MRIRSDDRGQAIPLGVVALTIAALAVLVIGQIGRAVVDRTQAQNAADAVALADAAEGERAGAVVANANGGVSIERTSDGAEVEIVIRVGEATGRARALGVDNRPADGGSAGLDGLAVTVVVALDRAEAMLGQPVPITSGFRSRADQQRLWDNRASNPYPVARPGRSRHESGTAIDVPSSFVARLLIVARVVGLCQPYPVSDPIHFELC